MIATYIRYKIYEYCIDLFFRKLISNFKYNDNLPKVGDRFSKIIFHSDSLNLSFYKAEYGECVIIDIDNAHFKFLNRTSHYYHYNNLIRSITYDEMQVQIFYGIIKNFEFIK